MRKKSGFAFVEQAKVLVPEFENKLSACGTGSIYSAKGGSKLRLSYKSCPELSPAEPRESLQSSFYKQLPV
jgi:hypothetical protein